MDRRMKHMAAKGQRETTVLAQRLRQLYMQGTESYEDRMRAVTKMESVKDVFWDGRGVDSNT